MSNDANKLQFAALQSFVSPTFWHKLAEIKLDYDQLNDQPKSIWGYYSNRNNKSCLLEVDYTAFNEDFNAMQFCYKAIGTIYNKNTLEDFKNCDKMSLLREEGLLLIKDFETDNILNDPSYLARFFILSFADLKNHNYYYWFCFPCPLNNTFKLLSTNKLKEIHSKEQLLIVKAFQLKDSNFSDNFFILMVSQENLKLFTLKEFHEIYNKHDTDAVDYIDVKTLYFCFADNSEYMQPSWLMRVYANFLFYKFPFLCQQCIKFLGLRYDQQLNLDNSLIWHIKQDEICTLSRENNEDGDLIKFVGWEFNCNKKLTPRMVCLKDSMDSDLIAENFIQMNLKLMKWRVFPDLNLNILTEIKCLLFGAGTLGCMVARMLLGWGFKHITFLDGGTVSYANPVRQYLYTHEDAVKGNAKAVVASKRLKEINSKADSSGYVIHIPMPSYPIGEHLKKQTEMDLNIIKDLVKEHDVLFLLTDSRESRWLPTLMGAAYNKIVINAALGFDSYLVQRHSGKHMEIENVGDSHLVLDNLKCIPGQDLGCYFCNEITAPGNSQKDRTLDQQCTVTRPGVSNIAASYAVELLVALLHHPLKENAPAYYTTTTNQSRSSLEIENKIPQTPLGIIPHSIRGSLLNYVNIMPASFKFNKCIACSQQVIEAFLNEGNAFLFKVFESGKYLEDLTGISEDNNDLDDEIIDYNSDNDLELSN